MDRQFRMLNDETFIHPLFGTKTSTNGTSSFIAAIGLKPAGLAYDEGEDDHLAKIFILSLCPKDEPGPYLEFITRVAQVLSDAEKRDKLIAATTPEEARKIMVS